MRKKEKLLHVIEVSKGQMVKCFARSAAGKQVNKPENLRPPKVLLKTVSYLLFDVITTKTLPWHAVYDFISDRIMAVRQDMVVQDITKAENITILQPIIRFYAYAAYNLCEESLSHFDPVLNNTHLQECLKKLLYLYDLCNKDIYFEEKCYEYLSEVQPEFEAMYVLFNLGNDEALRRALAIRKKDFIIEIAVEISLAYKYGNFMRACRLMKKLPALLAALASLHLPYIRRKAFQTMSIAYSSKILRFPTHLLREMLLYESVDCLLNDLNHYGISGDKVSISFRKESFLSSKDAVKPRREQFFSENLQNLENILFRME